MTHYLLVRCRDKETAIDAMEIIQREYEARGVCSVEVGNEEQVYHAASDIAEDCSSLELIIIDPDRDEEGDL